MALGMLQKWVTFNMATLFIQRYDFYPSVSGVTDDYEKFHAEKYKYKNMFNRQSRDIPIINKIHHMLYSLKIPQPSIIG